MYRYVDALQRNDLITRWKTRVSLDGSDVPLEKFCGKLQLTRISGSRMPGRHHSPSRIEKGPFSETRSVGAASSHQQSLPPSFDVISSLRRNSSRKVFERKRSCRTFAVSSRRRPHCTANNIRIHSRCASMRAQTGWISYAPSPPPRQLLLALLDAAPASV